MTSYFEGYIATIEEQEIPTKYFINKRTRDAGKKLPCDNKCCLPKTIVENIIHIISCCPSIPAHYYLPVRHDMVENRNTVQKAPHNNIVFTPPPLSGGGIEPPTKFSK